MLTIASSSIGVNAAENYIIIDYVKYYLVNNKIIYTLTLLSSFFGILLCSVSLLKLTAAIEQSFPFIKIGGILVGYDAEYWTKDLSSINYLKVLNYTTTAYGKFFITCLYGELGFTYKITKSNI